MKHGERIEIDFGIKSSDVCHRIDDDNKMFTINEINGCVASSKDIEQIQKNKSKKRHRKDHQTDTLILWDIENVNYSGDEKEVENTIRRLGIERAWKYIAYRVRRDKRIPFWMHTNNSQHRFIRLRNRGWQLKKKSKDADDLLFKLYRDYKNRLKALMIITADRDFKEIALDAQESGIHVIIANPIHHDHWAKSIGVEFVQLKIL
jgi:hypothetical protein